MNESDRVALVALVVSLIALGIALGQTLQQYFGTAEGYRRCQDSVMGPWAKFTRLRWRWSEFRFETRFTTPEIRLLTLREKGHVQPSRKWAPFHPESNADFKTGKEQEKEPTDDPDDVRLTRNRHSHESRSCQTIDFDVTDHRPTVPRALRETVMISRRGRHGTDLVSWTGLLRSLHQYQNTVDCHNRDVKDGVDIAGVTVRINEWSWDLVPPDVVRPYATSTVGTIISLAHRLGMQWSNLTPSKGEMNAEGNGHEISSTSVRGLGILLQYNYYDRLDTQTTFRGIPTHAADKLRCGIIPSSGSPEFDNGEHSLIAANGEHAPLEELLKKLRVNRSVQAILVDRKNLDDALHRPSNIRHVLNDLVCLMCPFMPLHGDWRNSITWPMRVLAFSSPLIFWEGRKTLYQRLGEYVREKNLGPGDLSYEAFQTMEHIQSARKYESNFYSKWDTAVSGEEGLRDFIQEMRAIFDRTTAIFQQRQDRTLVAEPSRLLRYRDLVGAHLTMATKIGNPARRRLLSEHPPLARSDNRQPRGPGVAPFQFEIAHHYADHLDKVVGHLQEERGCTLPAAEIEGLWWTLMLRGICWSMSVNVSLQESVVPSHLYYSPTPVYIV